MALTNAFYEAVNSNNLRRVRIMMKDSLLVDPEFNLFKEMDRSASRMQGLYAEHDGREFNLDKSTWNKDYMNKLMVQVVSNFSHERVNHLKDVVSYLNSSNQNKEEIKNSKELNNYKTKPNTNTNIQKKKISYQEQKELDKKNGTYRGAKIATGALVGAVVGGTAASVASLTVVGGAVAGAVVGGTVVAIVTNKE